MTSRLLPVNLKDVNFFDGAQVTDTDFTDEQTRNVGIDAATENNFFGGGVMEEFATPPVIFDTDDLNTQQQALLDSYSFDGQNVYIGTVNDVSDTINGVLLAVQITDCRLEGAANIKVSVMGDTFGGDLIHDDLTFLRNGTQVTLGRYKTVRAILFNNFAGSLRDNERYATDDTDGYALIGRCLIRETMAMEVSADPIMVAQTAQPSIYWSNFLPATYTTTVTEMLQDAIGADKSIDDLNIGLASLSQRELLPYDVTTRIGQKFSMTGVNIQKISVLLSTKYNPLHAPGEDGYEWRGDVVLTLNKLQTEVDCPVTPTPDNTIDFDPDPTIIAQIALNSDDLLYQGVVLGYAPQIVDFVFTGSNISDPIRSTLEVGGYYVFTISRSGAATYGTLQIEEATDRIDNSYMVVYDGTQWINITENDMWFSIYGNYVKIADGIAYSEGVGVQIPRIAPDSTNTEAPYLLEDIPVYTVTRDAYNYVLLEITDEFSDSVQDQRTGDNVYSRVAPSPEITLIDGTALTALFTTISDPVLLGTIRDENSRGNPTSISGETCLPGLVMDNIFNIVNPDADILQNNLVGSILYPSTSCGGSTCEFRIISQTHYNDAYGDVNGDGVVDTSDLVVIDGWISLYTSIDISNTAQHYLFYDGYISTVEFLRADVNGDGVVNNTDRTLILNYINKSIATFPAGSTFSRTELKVSDLDTTIADIPGSCCTSFTTPMVNCIDWRIDYFATWLPDLLTLTDIRRLVATTYTDQTTDYAGKNNFFVPGDLLLEGDILNPDKTPYSVDFEVNHLSLTFPVTDSYGNPTFLDGYTGILLFDAFVAESSNGLTSSEFNAMQYSDRTYVQLGDFTDGKVKISASLQSIANTYPVSFGGDINDIVGMYYNPSTSLLMLYVKDLYTDGYGNLLPALNMRVLVTVYLKKAGFINQTTIVTADQMKTLLGI